MSESVTVRHDSTVEDIRYQVQRGHVITIETLYDAVLAPSLKVPSNYATPENVEVLKFLVGSSGLDVNAKKPGFPQSPSLLQESFRYVAMFNRTDNQMIQVLLDSGATITTKEYLQWFFSFSRPQADARGGRLMELGVLMVLVRARALDINWSPGPGEIRINDPDYYGSTPSLLKIAAGDSQNSKFNIELVKLLLEQGADILPFFNFKYNEVEVDQILSSLPHPNMKVLLKSAFDQSPQQARELAEAKADLARCRAEKSTIQEALNALNEEFGDLSARLLSSRGRNAALEASISTFRAAIASLEQQVSSLTVRNTHLLHQVGQLRREVANLQAELASARAGRPNDPNDPPEETDLPEEPEEPEISRGYVCTHPYPASSRDIPRRIKSCIRAEGGVFDNIRRVPGGRWTNRQPCVNSCNY